MYRCSGMILGIITILEVKVDQNNYTTQFGQNQLTPIVKGKIPITLCKFDDVK